MTKQEKIDAILKKVSGKDNVPAPDELLFDSGYLDSFMINDLATEIETEFSLKIPDSDLTPRKFESVERISEYLSTRA
jgi:acyl carrier protein